MGARIERHGAARDRWPDGGRPGTSATPLAAVRALMAYDLVTTTE